MRRPRPGVAAFAALALALPACGAPATGDAPHPEVAGRWAGDREELELFSGGRLLLRRGAARGVGRFEWVEPDRMLVSYEGVLAGSVPGDYRAAVAGDTLSLCENDAPTRCMRFVRVPEGAPRMADGDTTPPRLALTPRADQMPPEARMREATGALRHVFVLQQTYHAEHGRYAPNLHELRTVGYEPPTLRHFLPPRLVRADDRLCIVAEPRSPELWPMHVDGTGTVREGRECR